MKKIILPALPDYSPVTLIVIIMAIVAKLLLGAYTRRMGHRTDSDSLRASGQDATFDAVLSLGTLVSAVLLLLWGVNVDAWIALLISAFIMKAGVEMLREVIDDLLGHRISSALSQAIKADIAAQPGVMGVYDLYLDSYGPRRQAGSAHVEVADNISATDLDLMGRRISLMIFRKYNAVMTIGFYAVPAPGTPMAERHERLKALIAAQPSVLGVHGLRIDDDERRVYFDVVRDFRVSDVPAWIAALTATISREMPGYEVGINPDLDYSD